MKKETLQQEMEADKQSILFAKWCRDNTGLTLHSDHLFYVHGREGKFTYPQLLEIFKEQSNGTT